MTFDVKADAREEFARQALEAVERADPEELTALALRFAQPGYALVAVEARRVLGDALGSGVVDELVEDAYVETQRARREGRDRRRRESRGL